MEDLSLLFYDDFDAPDILSTWKDDAEFGRQVGMGLYEFFLIHQFLCGSNPVWIKRCISLPIHFPVTEKIVSKILPKGTTLAGLMEEGP